METKETFTTKAKDTIILIGDVMRQVGALFFSWVAGLLVWSIGAILKNAVGKMIAFAGTIVFLYWLYLFIK